MGGDTLLVEPSVDVSADLPQVDALPSEVRKKKSKKKKSSVQNITDVDPGFSANTVSVPVESLSNEVVKRSHAPKIEDSDPGCLKGAISLENVQSSGRDVHLDSPQGTDALLEEPSINVSADLPQVAVLPSEVRKKKSKKKKSSVQNITDVDPGFSANTVSVPVESRSNEVVSHAPKIDDSDPGCLKGPISLENLQSSGRDVNLYSPQGTDALLEEPSINVSADLPQVEALPSEVRKKKSKKKKSSVQNITDLDPGFSANTVLVPVESRSNELVKRSHAPKIDDSDPGCLKGAISLENAQSSGRDVHLDSPQVTDTLLEEPPMPHADMSRKKRKKKKTVIGVAPDSENSCMESRAGTLKTPNSEKDNRCEILETNNSKEEKDRTTKKRRKTHESKDQSLGNDKRFDPSVGTSLVENIMPGVDPSQPPPVSELLEQKVELPLPLMEGISTSSGGPIPNVDLSCSKEKKKKKKWKTHESNVEGCDFPVCTSLGGNTMPGLDLSQQPPASELAEQKLELPQALMEGISTTSNVDLSCSQKKKKKKKQKTHESNVEGCDLSVGTSLEGNIMQGVDPSQQPPVSELAEQKLALPQPPMEGISTRSSGSPIPDVDLSCSHEKKKTKKRKTHASDVQGCDLSIGTSLGRNVTGVDPSQQPPVSEHAEQKLELPQQLMEGISTTSNVDLSCSQEKKKKKKRKTHESNVEGCDLSVGTSLGGSIMPVVDQSVQPPVVIPSEHELEVEQSLVDGIGLRTNSESPRPVEDTSCSQPTKKRKKKTKSKIDESNGESCDPSLCPPLEEKIIPEADPPLQPLLAILSDQDLAVPKIHLEESTFQESGVKGTSLHCSDTSPEAENIIDRQRTEAKTEVAFLPHSAVKADVDVDVIMDGSLSQISNAAPERSPVSCSKKKLLILDVNGLLADILQQECCSFSRYEPDIIVSRKAVFKRPFCDDFLQFCFDRFNVGVWSSRTKKNVDTVIDFLLGDSRQKLLFCWNQSHCTTTRFNTLDNRSKPLVLKDLRKLWEKVDSDLPWVRGEYNESNTLLLDDSPYKALCNPANTGIYPYSYKFKDRRDPSLGPGGEIRSYLERLAAADHVQKYVEQNPFGQRPITNKSRSWSFYRKVLEEYSRKD